MSDVWPSSLLYICQCSWWEAAKGNPEQWACHISVTSLSQTLSVTGQASELRCSSFWHVKAWVKQIEVDPKRRFISIIWLGIDYFLFRIKAFLISSKAFKKGTISCQSECCWNVTRFSMETFNCSESLQYGYQSVRRCCFFAKLKWQLS